MFDVCLPMPWTKGHVDAVEWQEPSATQTSRTQHGLLSASSGFFAQAARLARDAKAVPPALGTWVQCTMKTLLWHASWPAARISAALRSISMSSSLRERTARFVASLRFVASSVATAGGDKAFLGGGAASGARGGGGSSRASSLARAWSSDAATAAVVDTSKVAPGGTTCFVSSGAAAGGGGGGAGMGCAGGWWNRLVERNTSAASPSRSGTGRQPFATFPSRLAGLRRAVGNRRRIAAAMTIYFCVEWVLHGGKADIRGRDLPTHDDRSP